MEVGFSSNLIKGTTIHSSPTQFASTTLFVALTVAGGSLKRISKF